MYLRWIVLNNIYLCNISILYCIAPSSGIAISSRRKIRGGQKYRSYVTVENDRVPQFDQCHVIVVPSRRFPAIIRMYNDFVDWDYLLGSFHYTKIVFTCSQLNKMLWNMGHARWVMNGRKYGKWDSSAPRCAYDSKK